MTDATDDENEEVRRKKKGDSGEGDSDSWGRGKAGAGAGGGIRIPPTKLKEVMADWRHLDVKAVVEAVAEFFSDLPMRASANLQVKWEQTKANVKSFAIVNWLITFGERTALELARTRDTAASRDSRGLQKQKQPVKKTPGTTPNMKFGPQGPTGS